MSGRITIRLPKKLLERLRQASRRTGLPMARFIRESLEKTLSQEVAPVWREFAGIIKGGPPDVSSRKGFSRGPQ
jgi:hypothetical protein